MNKSLLKANYIAQSGSNFTFAFYVTIQTKTTEQYIPVALFIMLYKVDNTHLPSTAERSAVSYTHLTLPTKRIV